MPAQTNLEAPKVEHAGLLREAVTPTILSALKVFVFLAIVLGLLYPLVTTLVARIAMPNKSVGSPVSAVVVADKAEPRTVVVGSKLIGLDWTDSGLFEGRPKAAGVSASNSGATNLALTNPKLAQEVRARVERWRKLTGSDAPVPISLVTASASGLDPDITEHVALYQVPYVAKKTGLSPNVLKDLIYKTARQKTLDFDHGRLINVLELNQHVLEAMKKK